MAHIVVVGAGVGGVPCAYELRKKLGKEHRVTLVGTSPYFEFTPSNPWMAVGWRKCEDTRVELREPLQAPVLPRSAKGNHAGAAAAFVRRLHPTGHS